MNKRYWFFISLVVTPFTLDYIFQWIVQSCAKAGFSLGPLAFKIIYASDTLSSLLLLSSGVTSLIFLMLSFYLLLILLAVYVVFIWKLEKTQLWVALFTGGLLAYFLNGLIHSQVIQWVHLFGMGFNIAFICVILGLIGTVIFYFKERKQFRAKESRKQIFIMKDQYNFCLSISLTYVFFIISTGSFSYLFIRHLNEQIGAHIHQGGYLIHITTYNAHLYLFLFIILSVFLCVVFSLFLAYLSNRIYGPIYSFKKYITEWLIANKKPDYTFQLRKTDHFKFLEELMKELEKAKTNKKN